MEIKSVGILGCGLMGSGIAQVCATAGFEVTVLEVEQKYLDKGFAGIEKSLAKFAERPVEKAGSLRSRRTRFGRGSRGPLTKRTWPIATLLLRPSLRTLKRRRRCGRRSTPS
jgi:hypothetical protein